ncbi:hypothetical protein H9P43_009365 [Blastocladiella emersonii ATCC 22665]|nr:hypothetical protein H9P43_009365 [Blastocladiella emersonii ATCC 22665]
MSHERPYTLEDDMPVATVAFTWVYAILMTCNVTLNSILVHASRKGKLLTTGANLLIVNLAIADMGLALANLPFWTSNAIAGRWITGQFGCTWMGIVTGYFVFNTVTTLFLTTAERYLSIVRKKKVERDIVIKLIAACWVGGGGYAVLPLLPGGSGYVPIGAGAYCSPDWSSRKPTDAVLKVVICVMISSTILAMVGGYWNIIAEFRKSQKSLVKKPAAAAPPSTNAGAAASTAAKLGAAPSGPGASLAAAAASGAALGSSLGASGTTVGSIGGGGASASLGGSMIKSLLARSGMDPDGSINGGHNPIVPTKSSSGSPNSSTTSPSPRTSGIAFGQRLSFLSGRSGSSASPTASASAAADGAAVGGIPRSPSAASHMSASGASTLSRSRTASGRLRLLSRSAGSSMNASLSPAAIAARKQEKMLLKRAVAVVGAFIACWLMYLYVWIITWVSEGPLDPIIGCVSALPVALIGVFNPLITFTLDKRFAVLVRRVLGLPAPVTEGPAAVAPPAAGARRGA